MFIGFSFSPLQSEKRVAASDASDYGIGATLLHKFEDGVTKPKARASRALLPTEKNYSQIEKEGLAITYAVKKIS